jgi:hypothetical protein
MSNPYGDPAAADEHRKRNAAGDLRGNSYDSLASLWSAGGGRRLRRIHAVVNRAY